MGDLTAIFLGLGSSVVAVEPQAENIEHLGRRFVGNPNLIIVGQALGESEGSAELFVCNASDCSSLSADFVAKLSSSGRVPCDYEWTKRQSVKLTTLDNLIARYGKPHFIKIDVEGYEYEVLKGLSQAIKTLSFEFTPERLRPALECVKRLGELGEYQFNFTIGRRPYFTFSKWISPQELCIAIADKRFHVANGPGGDVYARLMMQQTIQLA